MVEVESFYKYLISNGYYFDKELIENYLLSLKVKPFVILTGNSGTGKTKLSQLFAQCINSSLSIDGGQETNFVKVKGRVNFASWSTMGWTLDKSYFTDFLPIRDSESKFNMVVDEISAEGGINISVQLDYDSIELKDHLNQIWDELPPEQKKKYSKKGPEIDILIKCEDIKNILEDPLPIDDSIKISKKSNYSAYHDRQWNLGKNIFPYFPFKWGKVDVIIIVDGIKSTAKARILLKLSYSPNKELQDYLKKNEGKEVNIELKLNSFDYEKFVPKYNLFDKNGDSINYGCFDHSENFYKIIPVGANWTDNANIIGYHNVITGNYQPTPSYKLINNAKDDLNNPYFLILDEMNLSHVERYFADILSAIESGEEIPLYGKNENLKLPENLFIIGTVNVDETTYMFSPKVLDRANTIEFDTLPALDYMTFDQNDDDFRGDINYLQSPLLGSDVSKLNIYDLKEIFKEISYNGDSLWDTLATELSKFQDALKGSGFEFGFRVINEILRFMLVAWRYENPEGDWNKWERYFDAQIKQKILPKLHGSEKAIGNVLTNLFNLCLIDRENNENPKNFDIKKENCRYYTSAVKIQNMSKVLSDQRYVSFIN